ncbi:hypothetical protein NDU88_003848 [Pleurodeles waltl]|uniref:Uncharacterized protein n=1 Tax=Pleurodeles waltl TaxID=8319 RepID=A0AAV7VJ06_PLEWA|nr:hypothetical protein NDU88_003848 [Pleurodeles waltl]
MPVGTEGSLVTAQKCAARATGICGGTVHWATWRTWRGLVSGDCLETSDKDKAASKSLQFSVWCIAWGMAIRTRGGRGQASNDGGRKLSELHVLPGLSGGIQRLRAGGALATAALRGCSTPDRRDLGRRIPWAAVFLRSVPPLCRDWACFSVVRGGGCRRWRLVDRLYQNKYLIFLTESVEAGGERPHSGWAGLRKDHLVSFL